MPLLAVIAMMTSLLLVLVMVMLMVARILFLYLPCQKYCNVRMGALLCILLHVGQVLLPNDVHAWTWPARMERESFVQHARP